MPHPLLDNVIWSALTTKHASLAIGGNHAKRYPAETAPFAAIDALTREASDELLAIIAPGESVGMLNLTPEFIGDAWEVGRNDSIVQMIYQEGGGLADSSCEPEPRLLTEDDIPAMLELTALVYPAYFRPATARLGNYYGIFDGERLCSMAGERMGLPGYQEISAVCTHPDYLGRRLATRLVRRLVDDILGRGETPILHADEDNERAIRIYQGLGFELNQQLRVWVLKRL